jgi:hypothetical protein
MSSALRRTTTAHRELDGRRRAGRAQVADGHIRSDDQEPVPLDGDLGDAGDGCRAARSQPPPKTSLTRSAPRIDNRRQRTDRLGLAHRQGMRTLASTIQPWTRKFEILLLRPHCTMRTFVRPTISQQSGCFCDLCFCDLRATRGMDLQTQWSRAAAGARPTMWAIGTLGIAHRTDDTGAKRSCE